MTLQMSLSIKILQLKSKLISGGQDILPVWILYSNILKDLFTLNLWSQAFRKRQNTQNFALSHDVILQKRHFTKKILGNVTCAQVLENANFAVLRNLNIFFAQTLWKLQIQICKEAKFKY